MCHLILGDTKGVLTMFVRKKKYPSGNIGIIVVEKIGDKMKERATIDVVYLTKGNINKSGYNKFLSMDGEVKVAINYKRVADDSIWDGLKGYLTNTDIPIQDVYTAYHNLWHVERAFSIAKSKIEIRPMFYFTRKRIEIHICICFVALKVYKELERMLKVS